MHAPTSSDDVRHMGGDGALRRSFPRCIRDTLAAGEALAPGERAFVLLTVWRQVERYLLPWLAMPEKVLGGTTGGDGDAPPCLLGPVLAYVDACLESPVHAALARGAPDAALNTLRYLFFHMRCGVALVLRAGAVAAFVPFANMEYHNTWHARLVYARAGDGPDGDAAARAKSRALRRGVERLLPPERQWLNGATVCNVMPDNVWGETYLGALRGMVDATAEAARAAGNPLPDAVLFLNKRDAPQLRRTRGADAYEAHTGEAALGRECYAVYAPIASFYAGDSMADLPMPTTEDWATATGNTYADGGAAGAAFVAPTDEQVWASWDGREPRAVFRGAASGAGTTLATNVRLRLAAFGAARPDLVDAGVVSFNSGRDKVVALLPPASATSQPRMRVDFMDPEDVAGLPRRVERRSMADQAAAFKYVLYADGHAAAGRYGSLMHMGCVVLRIASDMESRGGHLWLSPLLTGAQVGVGGGAGDAVSVPEHADHFVITPDLGNLEATIAFLRTHDDIARQTVRNARRAAPTRASIVAYWDALLRRVGRAEAIEAAPAAGGGGAAWFSPADSRYARLGMRSCSCLVSTDAV